MLDTMTATKIVGGLCGALLVFLLGGWVAETIYTDPVHVGEEGEVHQAYVIPVEGAEGGEAEPEVSPEELAAEFEAAFASADASAGEGEFRPCSACHSLEGENKTGPHLDGVVGRAVDAVEGFDYSGALEQVSDTWTPEALNAFLLSPKDAAPGTKMNFNGIRDVQDRANLIAYLATVSG